MWNWGLELLEITPWLLVTLVALILTTLRLPGGWLIVLEAIGYGWWTEWDRVGWLFVGVMVVLALLGELLELATSVLTARKVGASRRAAWGGFFGGFFGMIFLSFLVPIPVVGTLCGAVMGCFIGATIGELTAKSRLAQGARVGLFSAMGFVLGTVAKLVVTFMMAGTFVGWIGYLAVSAETAPAPEGASDAAFFGIRQVIDPTGESSAFCLDTVTPSCTALRAV